MNASRFAAVSVHQRLVRQRMKAINQRLMSVRQRQDLKCIYILQEGEIVTVDVIFGVRPQYYVPRYRPY